jgi:hypothetical protein
MKFTVKPGSEPDTSDIEVTNAAGSFIGLDLSSAQVHVAILAALKDQKPQFCEPVVARSKKSSYSREPQ